MTMFAGAVHLKAWQKGRIPNTTFFVEQQPQKSF
jgi:hypothetical protein